MPRPQILVPLIAVLVAGTVGLAGFQLAAGAALADAGRWIDRTQEWQAVLLATSEAIEEGSLRPAEGGGFVLPWEAAGTHPFPIQVEDVVQALNGMTLGYPLALADHDEAARRTVESHELLREQLDGMARLGPLASVAALPPTLRSAAVDAGGLMRPVYRLVGAEAAQAGLARWLLAAAALVCAAVVIALAVRAVRLERQRDRWERHANALSAGPAVNPQ